MESWHSTKLLKYSGLASVISCNGWYCDLFTIEVGARGYCSRSVTTCLKRLGFCNNLAFASAKKLGEISMRASFMSLLIIQYILFEHQGFFTS